MSEKGPEPQFSRVIAMIDVDAFEDQVMRKVQPIPYDTPSIVVNNTGRILSMSYEAREFGITKEMKAKEAIALCNNLHIFRKPYFEGKPDDKLLRKASNQILEIIFQHSREYKRPYTVELNGREEFYLDFTEEIDRQRKKRIRVQQAQFRGYTFIEDYHGKISKVGQHCWLNSDWPYQSPEFDCNCGYTTRFRLALCSVITRSCMEKIERETGFLCSAGIGDNKLVAKIACGLNRPNSITILPIRDGWRRITKDLPIQKLPGLSGKPGYILRQKLNIDTVQELQEISQKQLVKVCGKMKAFELKALAFGEDDSPVVEKLTTANISCGKNFHGYPFIEIEDLYYHIRILAQELFGRLVVDEKRNNRIAKSFQVVSTYDNGPFTKISRVFNTPFGFPDFEFLAEEAMNTMLDCKYNPDWILSSLAITARRFDYCLICKNNGSTSTIDVKPKK